MDEQIDRQIDRYLGREADEIKVRSNGGIVLTEENRRILRKSISVTFCAPHIPHRLVWTARLATNSLGHGTVTSYSKQPSAGINHN